MGTHKKPKELRADKDKFDAVLRRMIAMKPMPLKDVVGTSPRVLGKRKDGD